MEPSVFTKLDASAQKAVLEDLKARAVSAGPTATTNKAKYKAAEKEIQKALDNPGALPNLNTIEIVTGRFGNETEWARLHEAGKKALYEKLKKEEARWEIISRTLDRIAVLHNPDQVAGGTGEIPPVPIPPGGEASVAEWEAYLDKLRPLLGAKRINSSIGASWPTRVDELYKHVAATYARAAWPIWKLQVDLQAVEESG
jgi:hypothetical protein